MEASMHDPFNESPKDQPNIYRSWSMKLVALPLLLAIALIGYVVSHPGAIKRVTDGVQDEFLGTDVGPEGTLPKRVAQPSDRAHTTAR
jgi:hypothetical protein